MGCGVKKPPYYQESAPPSDDDVEFIITNPSVDEEENLQGSNSESDEI